MGYDHYSDETKSALLAYAKAWYVSAGLLVVASVIAFTQKPMFANPDDIPVLALVGAAFLATFIMMCVAIMQSVRYIKLERADRKRQKETLK